MKYANINFKELNKKYNNWKEMYEVIAVREGKRFNVGTEAELILSLLRVVVILKLF